MPTKSRRPGACTGLTACFLQNDPASSCAPLVKVAEATEAQGNRVRIGRALYFAKGNSKLETLNPKTETF